MSFLCRNGFNSVSLASVMDGYGDCVDNSDEQQDVSEVFWFKMNIKIPNYFVGMGFTVEKV